MIKKLLLFCILFYSSMAYAETIKTDVLVVGGSASGVAAAIQSARSHVKTLLVEPGPWLGGSMTSGGVCILNGNRNFQTGIWAEFRKHVKEYYKKTPGFDTTDNSGLRFEPYTGAAILKKITDTVKDLSVRMNTQFVGIKKDGDGWEVEMMANNVKLTIKAKALVDATETADAASAAGAKFTSGIESRAETGEIMAPEHDSPQILDISFIAILKDNGRAADRTIKKPEGYSPDNYTCLKGADIKQMIKDAKMLNDKYMFNCCGNQYTVTPEQLEPKNREETYRKARLKTLGFVYYLQTVLGYKNFSLEEYSTPDHLPYQPFIREYKRVKGVIRFVSDDIYKPYERSNQLYRTTIAVVDDLPPLGYIDMKTQVTYTDFPAYGIPLAAFVVRDLENMLVTENAISTTHLVNTSLTDPAVQMTIGQGVGASAAFLPFFKTNTKSYGLGIRIIQSEVLDYKGYIFPVGDIAFTDPYFRAVQQVCASGLLKGVQKSDGKSAAMAFQPDSTIKTADIKPIMLELYTRSFIWFNKNKPGEKFTVGNLLSFISDLTLTDPENLRKMMVKNWQGVYKFKKELDVNRPVTRYEFAVLTNQFINPFARRVDLSGKLIN